MNSGYGRHVLFVLQTLIDMCLITGRQSRRKVRIAPPKDSTNKNSFSNIIPCIPDFEYQPASSSGESSDSAPNKASDEFNIFDVHENPL